MNLPFRISGKLSWLFGSFSFIGQHFKVIMALGFIAGLGRVIQLGGFGEVTSVTHIVLEVIIESARLLLFVYALGLANVKSGLSRIKHLFTQKPNRKLKWQAAKQNFKNNWLAFVFNCVGFSLIAAGFNYLIYLLAYETCLYLTLISHQILVSTASEWTILLFFKNLSVIPFTLVFEALFFLWITNTFHLNKPFLNQSL
ncbi:hypothetical protein HUW51_02225 [Adhaeribacter swui]|uniref:Uncharacterized protein n=1 Tax=Adhaeribacter swui TaxID=2086471 RepID=A0A7G7G363_9BACT|nr:hypothetical protein [Adhaeribacter swui]QNF31597.1 hypothetical protein HUW51_02225 [Adhaeribacter swui]